MCSVFAYQTSQRDPSSLSRAEAFWNSFDVTKGPEGAVSQSVPAFLLGRVAVGSPLFRPCSLRPNTSLEGRKNGRLVPRSTPPARGEKRASLEGALDFYSRNAATEGSWRRRLVLSLCSPTPHTRSIRCSDQGRRSVDARSGDHTSRLVCWRRRANCVRCAHVGTDPGHPLKSVQEPFRLIRARRFSCTRECL